MNFNEEPFKPMSPQGLALMAGAGMLLLLLPLASPHTVHQLLLVFLRLMLDVWLRVWLGA